jgi:hypothetical protein
MIKSFWYNFQSNISTITGGFHDNPIAPDIELDERKTYTNGAPYSVSDNERKTYTSGDPYSASDNERKTYTSGGPYSDTTDGTRL